ncbi:serine hydrolase [Megalodesulfovibrio paquesii]
MVQVIRAFVCSTLAVLLLSGVAVAGDLNVKSAIVMDTGKGTVLFEQDPHRKIAPASLTKVMTMFVVWELIEQKKASLNDKIKVSVTAANTGGSTMNLKAGEVVTLKDLMYGMAVASGNDACIAVAEHYGGISTFVASMNRKAKSLGMKDTVYKNPNGLPAAGQLTTARDQLVLAAAYLKRFPNALTIHSTRSITHNKYTRTNSNRLLGTCPGVDGLKTGFVRASGFNIIVTAKRNNRRLIAVVLGGQSWAIRNREATTILNACFAGKQPKTAITAQVSIPATGLKSDLAELESAPAKPAASPHAQPAPAVQLADASAAIEEDADDVVVGDSDIPDDEDMAEAHALADATAEAPQALEVQSNRPAVPASRPTPAARLVAANVSARSARANTQPLAEPAIQPTVRTVLNENGPFSATHVAVLADHIVATSPYEMRGSIQRPEALDPVAVPRGLPQPAAVAQGVYYSIQESSWKDRDGAQDHTQKLRNSGLDARVVTVQLKQKGTWHRVVIGSFGELQDARQFRAQLKKNFRLDNTLIIQMDAAMEQSQAAR